MPAKLLGITLIASVAWTTLLAGPASAQSLSPLVASTVDASITSSSAAATPSLRQKPTGRITVPRTRPAVTIVLTSPDGKPITLSTRSAKTRKLPTGRYSLTAISVPGHQVVINGGRTTIQVRKNGLTRIPIAVTKLASVRFESVTTDGVSTVAQVAASRPVSVQVQFLSDSGSVMLTRESRVSGRGRPVVVSGRVVAAKVRVKPLNVRGETRWITLAPQTSLLATSQPNVAVTPTSVSIEAPISGDIAGVKRVDLATQSVTDGIPVSIENGSLSIQDAPTRPGSYEYQISGADKAGNRLSTSITVGIPDSSGNGLAVVAPNTRRVEVGTIEFPRTGAGLVAVPISSLPSGISAASLVGNPIIAVVPGGSQTAIGVVVEVRDSSVWIEQTGLHTVFQKISKTGFLSGTLRAQPQQPRSVRPKCRVGSTEIVGPQVEFGINGPTTDFSRWSIYRDGADVHIQGDFSVTATASLSAFSASKDLIDCYLDDLPMTGVFNINIPTPVGPIPTVLTVKPYVELTASVAVDFGTYSRSVTLNAQFNVSHGWNGPKLHTSDPFSVSDQSPPFELGSPNASVSIEGGLDFAFGFGQGMGALGLQVGGVSLKVGPRMGATFSTGAAAGEPDRLACLRADLAMATASVEMHLAEVWGGGGNSSLGDYTLFELRELTAPSIRVNCWGDAPPYFDDVTPGDMDADGIRDKFTYRKYKSSNNGDRVRLTVTASSTGKTSSINVGDNESYWFLGDSARFEPVDGQPGVEAIISGVMGANSQFAYVVTWRDGRLQFVPPPGQDDDQWNFLNKHWGFDYHVRRIEQGRVIVTNLQAQLRPDYTNRTDEVLTVTQYEWARNGWTRLKQETTSFPYPQTIKNAIDLSPYGDTIP